jgi:hypothetical protein
MCGAAAALGCRKGLAHLFDGRAASRISLREDVVVELAL